MSDPLDWIPLDYGSDRGNAIFVQGDVDPGPDVLAEIVNAPCPDCLANLWVKYQGGDPNARLSWHFMVAHDDGCPTLWKVLNDEA